MTHTRIYGIGHHVDRESLLMLLMFACLLAYLLSTRHLQILHAIRHVGHIVMSLGRATTSIHSQHIQGIFAMAQVAAMAGSTRKIHVLHGAVHVVVDHGSTAGDL